MKHLFLLLLAVSLEYSIVSGQIIINEIRASDSNIELKNIGASTVNIGTYWLCEFPLYNQLNSITTVCGDLNLGAGQTLMVDLSYSLGADDGELGLYVSSDFGNPAAIRDYVEWGSTGHVRSIVAQGAGIWAAGDFVPAWDDCNSLEYDGSGNSSTDWESQDEPTMPCLENSLDGCSPLPLELLSFRVTPVKDGAEIKWTGVHDDAIARIDLQHSMYRVVWNVLTQWTPAGPDFDYGEFTHLDIAAGLHYYRLLTIYTDGRSEPSEIAFIKMEYDSDQISIWPNPSTDKVDIALKTVDPLTQVLFTLKDMSGKLCWQHTGDAQVQLSLEGLGAGVYMLEVPTLGIAQRVVYAPD